MLAAARPRIIKAFAAIGRLREGFAPVVPAFLANTPTQAFFWPDLGYLDLIRLTLSDAMSQTGKNGSSLNHADPDQHSSLISVAENDDALPAAAGYRPTAAPEPRSMENWDPGQFYKCSDGPRQSKKRALKSAQRVGRKRT